VTLRPLALKILAAERAGGAEPDKVRRLLAALGPDELATLPGRWVAERAGALSWEDNLLALAERVLGLPTKPWDPASPRLRAWQEEVDAALRAGGAPADG